MKLYSYVVITLYLLNYVDITYCIASRRDVIHLKTIYLFQLSCSTLNIKDYNNYLYTIVLI